MAEGSSAVMTVTDETFDNVVLGASSPAIVRFHAPWCGPCRMYGPEFGIVAEAISDMLFCEVNVDNCQEVARRYGVVSIPTTIRFDNGTPTSSHVGFITRGKLREFIAKGKCSKPSERPRKRRGK